RRARAAALVVPVAGAVQHREPRQGRVPQGPSDAADAVQPQPVRDPVHGVPDRHLRNERDPTNGADVAGPASAGGPAAGQPRVLGLHDVGVQAPRTELRQDHLMTALLRRPPKVEPKAAYAIATSDLGVRYDLRFTKKTTVRSSIATVLGRNSVEQFWALRHVNLKVQRGESLAVIGPNGAGKSTLLQVLAGIIWPSEGAVDVVGHISGLLSLGAGFDKELSGRDNILLGGAFLGIDD